MVFSMNVFKNKKRWKNKKTLKNVKKRALNKKRKKRFFYIYDRNWINRYSLNHFMLRKSELHAKILKTYQFKIHCKGDSHISKTANITLPGLMIKQR